MTEELCTAFLTVLPSDGTPVANTKVRQALGWEESRYEAVRNQLLILRRIQKGRGRAGTVFLVV